MKQPIHEVFSFWFEQITHKERFGGGDKIDSLITDQFLTTHQQVAAGEWWQKRTTPVAYLAEVIVLDQFSRNLFRGQSAAFLYDGQALFLAQQAIAVGFDKQLPPDQRLFLYMPFMHSESQKIHEAAVPLFASLGIEESIQYEQIHKDIIDRFGRYPHRNKQLGRPSTAAEIAYLQETSESFFNS
jgi:uncharacterized protein (DUF924 family)